MNNAEIGRRLKEWAKKKYGSDYALAQALDVKPQGIYQYTSGKRIPGHVMQSRLRSLGCDIEWLMTGNTSESSKGPSLKEEAFLDILRKHNINSPEELESCLEQKAELERTLGPAKVKAFVEAMAVAADKQVRYVAKKRKPSSH